LTSSVSLPEHFDGDVASKWRPPFPFKGTERGEYTSERGVVAAGHGEADVGFTTAAFSELTIDTADFYKSIVATR
jgi:hypothetical protein